MSPLEKAQKESIIRRIAFAEQELADLDEYKALTFQEYSKDKKNRRNVERIAENLANAIIDIAKIMLAGEGSEMPGTYREVLLKLGQTGSIPTQLAERLANLIRIRNILAHQYLDIKWDTIKFFIEQGPTSIKEFLEAASYKVKSNEIEEPPLAP